MKSRVETLIPISGLACEGFTRLTMRTASGEEYPSASETDCPKMPQNLGLGACPALTVLLRRTQYRTGSQVAETSGHLLRLTK